MLEREKSPPQQRFPRIATWLLRLRYGEEMAEALEGDLLEEMTRQTWTGLGSRSWIWSQVARSLLAAPRASDHAVGAKGSPTSRWATATHLASSARVAIRTLRRRRLFTAVTSLTLALGIGASTLVVTVAYGVLVRPLPYDDAHQLVGLNRLTPEVTGSDPPLAMLADIWMTPYALLEDWDDLSGSFSAMGGYAPGLVTLTGQSVAESQIGLRTTSGVFSALRSEPLEGRFMLPSDDEVGTEPVVVLSHGLWQSRYGADPGIIGKTIQMSGSPYTVVGVMPGGFAFPDDRVSLWYSFSDSFKESGYRPGGSLKVIARLKRGISGGVAQHELDAIAQGLGEKYPDEREHGIRLTAYEHLVVGDSASGLSIFLGAVAMVALITCANIAGLLLIRFIEKGPELSVRAALGAGRLHVFVESVTEGMVLALCGGLLGVGFAILGLHPFVSAFPGGLPRAHELEVDGSLLLIGLGLSILVGLVIGTVPALRLLRVPIHRAIRGGRGHQGGGGSRNRLQTGLVVAQISMAFALLACAALFVKSYQRLVAVDPGFDSTGLSVMDVVLPDRYRGDSDACRLFFAQLFGKLESMPGVSDVAAVEQIPFLGGLSAPPVIVETVGAPEKAAIHRSNVSPSYFEAMGISLLSGRLFDATDGAETLQVTVVNRALAERYWPDDDPLGRRINTGSEEKPYWLTVVGVVGDVRYGARSEPFPEFYQSIEQAPQWYLSVVMKSGLESAALAIQAQEAVALLDRDIPVTVSGLEEKIARSPGFAGPRFGAFAISSLAAVAALLAVLGIYGVLAFSVVRRTQEIGVRMALGAQRRDLLLNILGRGSALVGLGLSVGVVVALLFGRLLDTVLFGITAADPRTFLQVATVIALSGIAACLIPARRATTVDPVRSLRQD